MDSYTPLLEKTRLPQPSLQKFAVTSIFKKLRSAPKYLDSDSEPGREAIAQCLHSTSPSVVDQSVRELCRLVTDSHMGISRGFLELQSALEGSNPLFVDVFIKALGFLVRYGFQKHNVCLRFSSTETHPFVKILLCRKEVQNELVRQVLLLTGQNKSLRMVKICEFLRPFLLYSVLRMPFSDSSSSSFARHLISSMAAFCCSEPHRAMPVFKLLIESLKYVPCKNLEEFQNFIYLAECIKDAYTVGFRLLVGNGSHLTTEAQRCSLQLLEAIHSPRVFFHSHSGGYMRILELSKSLLSILKEIGMRYVPELSSTVLSLFMILMKSALEHEQLFILKFLLFFLQWKGENEHAESEIQCAPSEELLFVFPAISLMSSPSKSVKVAAGDLLSMLEKNLVKLSTSSKDKLNIERVIPSVSTPGSVVFRLLQELWFQGPYLLSSLIFLDFPPSGKGDCKEVHDPPRNSWITQLREYSLWIVNLRKSSLPLSKPQEVFLTEMPLLLGAIAAVLVMHQSLGCAAVDSLAAIGILDPKIGVPLLLVILFYSNIFTRNGVLRDNMLLKLLEMLPSLASHPAMIPLIVQTILPMLRKDANLTLYATATRLLCKTWEINDRAFGSLQELLLPKAFAKFVSERGVSLSLASSIRDVCKKNADRGVDLILSVSACIESQDSVIQALGLQGLAHLCEADVIDFYTAWDVIAKHVLDYSSDPILACSICNLLRWGAMDAEAYPAASKNVLQILWAVGTSTYSSHNLQWTKARASALEALTQYEVSFLERNIPDIKQRTTSIFLSETDAGVLKAMKEFLLKIIDYEHINRRRLVKEKRVAGNKIEKLLDVFPRVIFYSGKNNARKLPGAALLCHSFTPKSGNNRGTSKGARDVHARYETILGEISESLQLSRNILVALLSLESWKSFVACWMKTDILSFDDKASKVVLDRSSKVAHDILKSMMRLAEESIPRSAENIALAIAALCAVLPPSAHTVKSTALEFLLNWLFQHEHEHRQWVAAISVGLISSCLHVTDHKLKFECISGLVEVLNGSKSTFVRGACGVGLGFSCQDLLTRVTVGDKSDLETQGKQEIELLGIIVGSLSLMLCQLTESSTDILDSLSAYFPMSTHNINANISAEPSHEKCDDLEEDAWGISGLVLGLAGSVGALYRAGAYDLVLKIKNLIISWIPHLNPLNEGSVRTLSVGSCLALPNIVGFCQRIELMGDNEITDLVNGYKELISELISVKKSGISHQCLLMASCIGAGNLLASILNEGVHSIDVEHVKDILELFRTSYSYPYPPLVHFGGMLGVINSMGAGAGSLVHTPPLTSSKQIGYDPKESSQLTNCPLLSSPLCEPQLTSMMQEIFLIAQNSDDQQMQQYAAWAVSLLRHCLWSNKFQDTENVTGADISGSKYVSPSFSEDSVVMRLCLWLTHLNPSKTGTVADVHTITTVLRCLSQAPRLPTLDWGAIIRRCMRYEDQITELLQQNSAPKKGILREECLAFSLAHANQFDPLLTFLDELTDLSRFRTLELNLQSSLLIHLADLVKVFSGSRVEKLFDNLRNFFSSGFSSQVDCNYQKDLLCTSCWKGLCQCLEDASLDSQEYMSHIEKLMEMLFYMLPILPSGANSEVGKKNSEECSEAVKCLGKARRQWLLDFLQVSLEESVHGDDKLVDVPKKLQVKAKLVRVGSLPLTELGKLKSQFLNSKLEGIWNVLVEVVAALQQAEARVKRQWLLDAVEISCISSYPSTALRFIGLLSSSCCKYMPLLILDPHIVLNDLPVTLTSLLSDSGWEVAAEPIISSFFVSMERIYNWATDQSSGDGMHHLQTIAESERDMAIYLLHVMHSTGVSLKDYLPLEKQLALANMTIPHLPT